MARIPLLVPDLPRAEELLPYLRRVDDARWYTNFGPLVRELEARLIGMLGDGDLHATTVSSCTLGLELGLAALGLPPGARVLIPAFTFVATASAVLRAGYRPVVADVDPESWLLTPALAERALDALRCDCVMPVTTFGCPQGVREWDDFSERTRLPVLIDAAGALGNQAVGRVHLVFSMHATKSLGAGEGGVVFSRDAAFVERVRRLSNFGIDLTNGIVQVAGTNAKLSEYHAAVALAALATWPSRAEARRRMLREYQDALGRSCPAIRIQARPESGVYTILAACLPEGIDPVSVARALATAGVETRRWYHPLVNDHPGFAGCEIAGKLPDARRLSGRILGLPFHVYLTSDQRERVCGALAAALDAGATRR